MKPIEELTELFLEEFHRDRTLTAEAFAARYPEQQGELLKLLPTIRMLEEDGSGEASAKTVGPADFPRRLEGFTLEKKLGAGGMGMVFLAKQESLNRQVAIKFLSPFLAMDEARRKAFEQESRIVAQLHHPNIVQVFGAGYSGGFSYFVMEWIDGSSLPMGKPHSDREVAQVGLQAASALAYAHSQKILHRDVKPGNMLMDALGDVHLSDFGLATMLSGTDAVTVTDQSREGTIRYMAPEIFLNNRYSFASDQYSLGVTLYEYLTGKPALGGETPGELIRAVCDGRVPALSEGASDLSVILNKCMAFRPEDRYADLAAVEADFRHFLQSEPLQARRTGVFHRFRLWVRRRPGIAILSLTTAVLLCALLVSSMIGYVMVSRSLAREAAQRQQAEENARIARTTLERIYRRSVHEGESRLLLPPSKAAASLLNDLLPFYEQLEREENAGRVAQIAGTRKDLALLAMQSGKYDVAEKLFKKAAEEYSAGSRDRAFCLNRRAAALACLGKRAGAEALWKQVAMRYEASSAIPARLEAVVALRSLAQSQLAAVDNGAAGTPKPTGRTFGLLERAMKLLAALRTAEPENPEAQFLVAEILTDAPSLASRYNIEARPFDLLADLLQKFPDNREYRYALIRAALRLDLRKRTYEENEARLQQALACAETLLAEMPADAGLIDEVADLYEKYLDSLHNGAEATRQSNRIIGIMKLLAAQEHNSEPAKEAALRFLLKQYGQLVRRRNNAASGAPALKEEIEGILDTYQGKSKDAFVAQLQKYSQTAAEAKDAPAPPAANTVLPAVR